MRAEIRQFVKQRPRPHADYPPATSIPAEADCGLAMANYYRSLKACDSGRCELYRGPRHLETESTSLMDEKDQTAQEAHRLGRTMRRNIRNVKSSHSDKVLLIAEDAVDKVTDLDQRQRVADMPADSQPVQVLKDITVEARAAIAKQGKSSDITSAEATAANAILTQAHEKTVLEADQVKK